MEDKTFTQQMKESMEEARADLVRQYSSSVERTQGTRVPPQQFSWRDLSTDLKDCVLAPSLGTRDTERR